MKLFFDFFPIALFFICYKLYGLYFATSIAIAASLLQVVFYRIKYHRFEKINLISFALILVLGGATLFFHNPWFIKCKPTGIYWLMALVFLLSPLFKGKPLIQNMMEGNVSLPTSAWYRLNYAWSLFFISMGSLNLYVGYSYSTDFWVNFKLFGSFGLISLFVCLQAIYLTRHTKCK